jgi:hypothetical protein
MQYVNIFTAGVSPKFFCCSYMVIRENLFVADFIVGGTIYRAPTKGRHMGLPLPEIVIYRYITWGMPNNLASF